MVQFIADRLAQGKRLALATVVSRTGSGPREPGATMAVADDGILRGTIGGGWLEAKTRKEAIQALQDGKARLLAFDLNAKTLAENTMVCGGRMEILVDVLDGGRPSHVGIFQRAVEALQAGRSGYLLTSFLETARGEWVTGHGLWMENGKDGGDLCDPFRDGVWLKKSLSTDKPVVLREGAGRCLVQPIHPPRRVFIVGAGHVGQALAAVCAMTGLQTVIIDDRSEFACPDRFPEAQDIVVCASYAQALKLSDITTADAVVIATNSHLTDRDALDAALATPAGYIGMIASRRKRDLIYASLLDRGAAKEDLARVRSPIGLDIGAQTPAEIAVAIAAELIAVKYGKA
jgi:xanthine dehydrogenase accessory factor